MQLTATIATIRLASVDETEPAMTLLNISKYLICIGSYLDTGVGSRKIVVLEGTYIHTYLGRKVNTFLVWKVHMYLGRKVHTYLVR
jgi:hypothetical protein